MSHPPGAPFAMLCRQDLPAHWKIPYDMDARTQAGLQLGLAAEQVEIVPCLVAPECSWFIAYLEWLHGQAKPNDSVSVFMWDTAAFFSVFGPKATQSGLSSACACWVGPTTSTQPLSLQWRDTSKFSVSCSLVSSGTNPLVRLRHS